MIISVNNNLTDYAQFSYTSVNIGTAGTIGVQNTNPFSAGVPVQIGRTGDESTEIAIPGTVSGTALIVPALNFSHPSDTPVFSLGFDKVIFKKSSAGTAGTATAITNGTVNITPDSLTTNFDDTFGLSTDAYKTAWYNSNSASESSESDWITPDGYPFYSLYSLRTRVKEKLKNSGFIGNDSVIDDWLNEWLEQMTNAAITVNEDYAIATVDVAFGTDGLGTINANDFKIVKRLWVTHNGTDYRESTQLNLNRIRPDQTFSDTSPRHSYFGDNVVLINPHSSAGTARITYNKLNTVLENDGDLLPLPMRGYTKSFIDYALAQARGKDEKDTKFLEEKAQAGKAEFISEITPRDLSGPQMIRIDVDISPESPGNTWV